MIPIRNTNTRTGTTWMKVLQDIIMFHTFFPKEWYNQRLKKDEILDCLRADSRFWAASSRRFNSVAVLTEVASFWWCFSERFIELIWDHRQLKIIASRAHNDVRIRMYFDLNVFIKNKNIFSNKNKYMFSFWGVRISGIRISGRLLYTYTGKLGSHGK